MRYFIVVVVIFLNSCSNDKLIIKEIQSNTKKYNELSNTFYKNLNSAIVVIKKALSKNNTIYTINIKPKDINTKLSLTSCKKADNELILEEGSSDFKDWSTLYTIYDNTDKKNIIKCTLNNNENFTLPI